MESTRIASPVNRLPSLQVDSNNDSNNRDDLEWTVLPTADFDEIVASIIVNPHSAMLGLKTPLVQRERDGSTLLHLFAGGENCEELIRFFLNAGIPVDMPDHSGWTPLLEAAQEGQIRNCEVLLAHGATPDLAAAGGMTPLRAAAKVGNTNMTTWLLNQPGTWSRQFDVDLFALLLHKTPTAAVAFLDVFAQEQSHSKLGNVAVKYTDLQAIYGDPSVVSVEQTALAVAASAVHGKRVLPHRVLRHVMKAKWHAFAKRLFRRELSIYCVLVASYYLPTIVADPNWVHLASPFDWSVASCRAIAWTCSLYLLLSVEYREFRGSGRSVFRYFQSFWNVLNFTSYVATLVSIPLEFIATMAEARDCLLAVVTVTLWINLLQFLQVSTQSGLLLAMMSRMRNDVARFLLLYSVFLCGFSGAFYLLLRGADGFETFQRSFVTVLLLLFGEFQYETFRATTGATSLVTHVLLFVYLVSVVVVLLNILIAMMATTYADIWDAAEAETMLCHAHAIVRIESALSDRTRHATYRALLGSPVESVAAAEKDAGSAASVPDSTAVAVDLPSIGGRQSSTQQLRAHVNDKRAMVASIVAKMQEMPASVESAVAAHSPTRAAAVKALVGTAAFKAPNLDALKESLFLKSTFDDDATADGDSNDTTRRELGWLDDGIRYEAPLRSLAEPKTHLELLLELQTQLQQLETHVKSIGGATSASGSSNANALPSTRRRKSLVRYASDAAATEYL